MFDRKVLGKTVIFMHLKVLGEIPVASCGSRFIHKPILTGTQKKKPQAPKT